MDYEIDQLKGIITMSLVCTSFGCAHQRKTVQMHLFVNFVTCSSNFSVYIDKYFIPVTNNSIIIKTVFLKITFLSFFFFLCIQCKIFYAQ